MTGVLAVSDHEKRLLDALERLRRNGFDRVEVFSPVADGALVEAAASAPSPIRYYTLAGAILGLFCGLALSFGMTLSWPIAVGGKPIISLTGFSVILFEVTILIGGLTTVAGFLIHGKLFRATAPKLISFSQYSERFSVDTYGLLVVCETAQIEEVRRCFRECGIAEVSVESS